MKLYMPPAFSSVLVLRRRSQEELINTEDPKYKVFMAVVVHAGEDTRGKLFQRAPDGEVLIFEEIVIERVRNCGQIEVRRVLKGSPRINDELPLVAERYKAFRAAGEVTL